MTRLCPSCGEPLGLYAVSKCHACAADSKVYVPTPEKLREECAAIKRGREQGGIFAPSDEEERAWRLAQSEVVLDSDAGF